ncbi:4-hydroxy-tetrahydrodipicolinate synthase [Paenibacillus baekrokdamisoli]|uniref:4-hydroxy-tetrahydrodipicolinate synthase n=1 Tax=Paenibacillus baekrokdamisoli TaxID=1712516 RepID=A0A3G9JPS2_9BACL|nr:dihydrodipicolinate synthase family protein [Paenibacillus baekrokdamisoli]MBB3069384.1 4-hydroxy-tetrahydrodipicolinate synthase [Paenibacillus baekrokdamisoli]BBH25059.1 4-hydroxy-tetrahydrodipicolinate synthase [Paenibacillus baekrokdamisoli]
MSIPVDRARFEGVFSLLLTPFLKSGEIDWKTYERYVEWQLAKVPNGLFAVCGSSDMKWLTLAERLELARIAVRIAGDVPVVATGNLLPDPVDHLQEVRQMAETGVAAVVLVPPTGMGADQVRLGQHFAWLAEGADCPVIVYEWPHVQPYLLDAGVYAELVRQNGIIGIKDTTCTIEGISAKLAAAPESVVYQANHLFMLDAIRRGARGIMAISTAANAELVVDFWKSAIACDASAEAKHRTLVTLDNLLIHQGGYNATAKLLARLQGMDLGLVCRSPIVLRSETVKAVELWFESEYTSQS